MKPSSREVVLITGASSGIGLAIANLLHTQGYIVYGASRHIRSIKVPFRKVEIDITSNDSIVFATDQIIDREGHIDILINCAGYAEYGAFQQSDIKNVRRQFETNFFGLIYLTQYVLNSSMLPNNKGTVCSIGSIGGQIGLPFQGAYSASKFALQGFTEALRLELRNTKVRIFLLNPGDVQTNLTKNRKTNGYRLNTNVLQQPVKTLQVVEHDERNGISPEKVARKLFKILQARNPKCTYVIGPFLQEWVIVVKKILPQKWFEWIIANHYGIRL